MACKKNKGGDHNKQKHLKEQIYGKIQTYARKIRDIKRKLVQEMREHRKELYLRYHRWVVGGKEKNIVKMTETRGGGERTKQDRTAFHENTKANL